MESGGERNMYAEVASKIAIRLDVCNFNATWVTDPQQTCWKEKWEGSQNTNLHTCSRSVYKIQWKRVTAKQLEFLEEW